MFRIKYLVIAIKITIGEIRFQFQSCSIGLYCFWDLSTVLLNNRRGIVIRVICKTTSRPMFNCLMVVKIYFMNGGQIWMSIGKGRINLNGSCVTLKSTIDILHLLKCVAHVTIRIGKWRLNPRFLKYLKHNKIYVSSYTASNELLSFDGTWNSTVLLLCSAWGLRSVSLVVAIRKQGYYELLQSQERHLEL